MIVYAELAALLNFSVDFLLLVGTNRLTGYPFGAKRAAAGAAIGAVYAYLCLMPGFGFFSGTFWRMIVLCIMSVVVFGWNKSALTRGILFVFLCMAMGGIALGMNSGGFFSMIAAAGCMLILCAVGFHGQAGKCRYLPVELVYGGQSRHLMALADTGNTLTDPVTGQQVLVAGADVAFGLLGLTQSQLQDPISTVASGSTRGLRLIPYRAVGQPSGMLLAVRMDKVTINGKPAGELVAFAPEIIGRCEHYQALAGGVV